MNDEHWQFMTQGRAGQVMNTTFDASAALMLFKWQNMALNNAFRVPETVKNGP